MIKVLSDEDKNVFTFSLGYFPLHVTNVAIEEHTNSLKDKLLLNSFNRKNALVSVQVGSIFLDETTDPAAQHTLVYIALDANTYRRDSFIMLVLLRRLVMGKVVRESELPRVDS